MNPRVVVSILVAMATVLAPAVARAGDVVATPSEPLKVAAPSRDHGATIARVVAPAFARRRLASAKHGWRVRTATGWSAQPQVLLVLAATRRDGRDWVKLLLANRPNGSSGWVRLDAVVLSHTPYWIDIRTGARQATVYREGTRVRRVRAVVGTPRTPTPSGLAAIYERNRQPDPKAFYGTWVLSLTALSNVLEDFGGGPGRVGIHGRGGASMNDPLGSARSHGCIRITNASISWIAAHVPAGTPVDIDR
jgi:hypothetical protein